MRVIDIFDNGGYRSITDDMLAGRLDAMTGEILVAAIRRNGPVADKLSDNQAIDLLTSGFGFGSRFSMPYKVRRLSKGSSPVIIHTHSIALAEQAALIVRAWPDVEHPKIVLELPSGNLEPASGRMRFALEGTDAIIFPTAADRDLFLKNNPAAGRKRIDVIPPVFCGSTSRTSRTSEGFTLIWGGRLTTRCGIDELIESLGTLVAEGGPSIKLLVAGQGKAAEAVPVIRRVKQLGLGRDIEFLGDTALTPDLMAKASALVVTSASDPFSPWSTAMAKSSGLPVIMACSERNRQLVPEGGALFYTPGDNGTGSLCNVLRLSTSNPDLSQQMSARMSASAQAHGLTDIMNLYSSLATS